MTFIQAYQLLFSFTKSRHHFQPSLRHVKIFNETHFNARCSRDMAKAKDKAIKGGQTQRHLRSRISYLYQAAAHLAENANKRIGNEAFQVIKDGKSSEEKDPSLVTESTIEPNFAKPTTKTDDGGELLARKHCRRNPTAPTSELLTHLRAVSRKSQIRLTPDIKNSICKRCDNLLLNGSTSTSFVDNQSRNRSKPWADVLVVMCTTCGTAKRFPAGARRQLKRRKRPKLPKVESCE